MHGYNQHKDLVPTLLELAGIETEIGFDGRSLMQLIRGEVPPYESEMYITECTWMRKHGWRTPEWKLIIALEPDFHFKPEVELYNLIEDPGETDNLAGEQPQIVELLNARMERGSPSAKRKPGCPTRSTTRATGTAKRAWARSPPRSKPMTRSTSATRIRPPNFRRVLVADADDHRQPLSRLDLLALHAAGPRPGIARARRTIVVRDGQSRRGPGDDRLRAHRPQPRQQ